MGRSAWILGVGLIGIVAGAMSAWATCVQVYDSDFIGSRCERPSLTTVYVTSYGTFTDAAGGTLSGYNNISYPITPDGTYGSYKAGVLRTGDFTGTMSRNEKRTKDSATGRLITTVTETRSGKHRLDGGGVLEPDAGGALGSSTSKLINNIGSGYTFTMEGKVTSSTFRGTLLHEERQDTESTNCNTHLKIEQTGEWSVPGAGRFTGTLTTVKDCTATGTPVTQVIDNRVKF